MLIPRKLPLGALAAYPPVLSGYFSSRTDFRTDEGQELQADAHGATLVAARRAVRRICSR